MILPKFGSCLFWKYWIYHDFVHAFSSNAHSAREVSTFWSKRALQKDNFVKRPVPKRRFCETAPSKKTILWNGTPPKRRFCETAPSKKTILWNGPPQKDDFVTHITNVCHKIVFFGACVSQNTVLEGATKTLILWNLNCWCFTKWSFCEAEICHKSMVFKNQRFVK